MNSKAKLSVLLQNINDLEKRPLSVQEGEILKYLSRELKRFSEIIDSFDDKVREKAWNDVISSVSLIVTKANMLTISAFQPTLTSTIKSEEIFELMDSLLDFCTGLIGEIVAIVKSNMKDMGLDSITFTVNQTMLTVNVSMVFKGA
ncbi:hypothetical protein HS7_03660 [Sulfolobales archaeon HS-7]|nr:hypothetical protein HS7_03660 [Sulfolobales archaeon HS-7]